MEIRTAAQEATGTDLAGTRYSMIDGDREVGYLLAHTSGLILNIEVDEDRQGEGIARALYEHADQAQGLYHVPAWGRTPDGERFVQAVGGDVMDDETAAAILGMDLSIYETD